MTKLVFTVDTEVSGTTPPPEQVEAQLFGRVDNGETYGPEFMLDRLAHYGWSCTFFIDVFGIDRIGGGTGEGLVARTRALGGDLQLHTHVEHLDGSLNARHMRDLGLDQQRMVLERGAELLHSWGATRPTWHRAGHLGANVDTLRACGAVGGMSDSSLAFGWQACASIPAMPDTRNALREIAGTRELPITTFRTLPGLANFHHLDVNYCVYDELATVTRQAVRASVPYLVVLMHSFSFVRRGRAGFELRRRDLARFNRYLAFLSRLPGIEVATLSDLGDVSPVAGDQRGAALHAGILPTYQRALVQWRAGWKQKVLVAAPWAAASAAGGLIAWTLGG